MSTAIMNQTKALKKVHKIKIIMDDSYEVELDMGLVRKQVPFPLRGELDAFLDNPNGYLKSENLVKKLLKTFKRRK
jgi:hypothetical protein